MYIYVMGDTVEIRNARIADNERTAAITIDTHQVTRLEINYFEEKKDIQATDDPVTFTYEIIHCRKRRPRINGIEIDEEDPRNSQEYDTTSSVMSLHYKYNRMLDYLEGDDVEFPDHYSIPRPLEEVHDANRN